MLEPLSVFLACQTFEWSPNQWNFTIIVLGLVLPLLFSPSQWHLTMFILCTSSTFIMFVNTCCSFNAQSSLSLFSIPSINKLSLLDWDSILTILSCSLVSFDLSWAMSYLCCVSSTCKAWISCLFWLHYVRASWHVWQQCSMDFMISSLVLSKMVTDLLKRHSDVFIIHTWHGLFLLWWGAWYVQWFG